MPNYPTHSRWGRIGAVVVALAVAGGLFYLFEDPFVALGAAIGAAVATFVGAIYPDVDHHTSIPRRKAVRGFQLLAAVGVIGLSVLFWEQIVIGIEFTDSSVLDGGLPVPSEMAAAWVPLLGAFIVAGLIDPLIGLVTMRHRGWTHSVPINFVIIGAVSGGVFLLTMNLPTAHQVAAVTVVWTFFFGALIHLGLDGEIF